VAEGEKADLLHDAASLARSDWMMGRNGARSVNLPFVNKLDSRPMAATEATRPSSGHVRLPFLVTSKVVQNIC
jgi:hypothetical protein